MIPMKQINVARLMRAITFAALALQAPVAWCQEGAPRATPLLEIKRFVLEGDPNPLSASETNAILARHLGQHTSLSTVQGAARALEAAIRGKGYSFHRVIVPAQEPVEGELRLRVIRFNLAEITVSGNRYFTSANILRALPELQIGKSPDVQVVARQLGITNDSPAKRTSVQFKESEKRDFLDADVRVRDVPTAQTFVGLTGGSRDFDNTINRNTGYTRLTVGHQRSNLFDLDHAATVAYTTSPDHLDAVKQIGVFYWAPIYRYYTTINAYYTYSDVDSGTVGVGGQNFTVSGRGEFWGLRATYTLPKLGSVGHSVSGALDSRYFRSDLGFQGVALPPNSVGSLPLSVRYSARHEGGALNVGGYLEYVQNLSSGRANSAASYATARVGADQSWNAWRWGVDANYAFADGWAIAGRLRGQHASEPLIPGEQFGVGGVGSVRGLRDRESSGDQGYTATLEVTAPPVYSVTPYAFHDFGQRKHVIPVAATTQSDHASSVGLGLRWNWEKGLDINVTYAHVLNGIAGGTPRGYDKLNFSLFYRF